MSQNPIKFEPLKLSVVKKNSSGENACDYIVWESAQNNVIRAQLYNNYLPPAATTSFGYDRNDYHREAEQGSITVSRSGQQIIPNLDH